MGNKTSKHYELDYMQSNAKMLEIRMTKKHLIVVALTIFISFGVFVGIKQGQSASDQADENESRIGDLESQIQDLQYRLR